MFCVYAPLELTFVLLLSPRMFDMVTELEGELLTVTAEGEALSAAARDRPVMKKDPTFITNVPSGRVSGMYVFACVFVMSSFLTHAH